MTTISGRLPTCQEVDDHARAHQSLNTNIGMWLHWSSELARVLHLQVLGTGADAAVFLREEKGWNRLKASEGSQFLPLTKDGKTVNREVVFALGNLLNRLGGDPNFNDPAEDIEKEIWAHVQYLEKNVRDGADFRHASRVLRVVEEYFPHQALPDISPDTRADAKERFGIAISTLTQALDVMRAGVFSGVESAIDTIANQARRFADQVRVLVHTREGAVTVTLALNNDHEIEILREQGWQPMDVTRLKLGTSLTVKARGC